MSECRPVLPEDECVVKGEEEPKPAQITLVRINLIADWKGVGSASDNQSRHTTVVVDTANPQAVNSACQVAHRIVEAFFKGMVSLSE